VWITNRLHHFDHNLGGTFGLVQQILVRLSRFKISRFNRILPGDELPGGVLAGLPDNASPHVHPYHAVASQIPHLIHAQARRSVQHEPRLSA
jgi:hypothetical protein